MRSLAMRTWGSLSAAVLAACASLSSHEAGHYEAIITRTSYGIAHIKAADYAGLGYGEAYARAQDNICLLAETYVSYAGERSKYFGAGGDTMIGLGAGKNLDSDFYHRAVLDISGLRDAFESVSEDYKGLVDGWVVGYNRFLQDNAGHLPAPCAGAPWVRAITRDDVLRSLNAFAVQSTSGMFALPLVNSAPPGVDVPKAARADLTPQDPMLAGSNGWAFGGDATTNGKGVVLANPHFPWMGPNRFYETHLTIPGKLDVAGAAITAMPFVGIGFTRDVAWTHTVDMAAHMTLYRLALDPVDPAAYMVDGNRETMTRRDITVEVKDGDPVTRTLYASRYGAIVSVPGTKYAWTREAAYALKDANRNNLRMGDGWLDMARARNVQDIREALARHLAAPYFNTMAADREGTALYADINAVPNVPAERFKACGLIEDRLPGQLQDLYVLDGSRSGCEWETSGESPVPGLLPASQQATLYRRDFVQSSNDSYRWSNPSALQRLGAIMGRDPGIGSLRTQSALEAIGAVLKTGKFDPAVAAATMFSNKVFIAPRVLPGLTQLCRRKDANAEACAALANWDGKANLDSRGAVLFALFWSKVGTRADLWKHPLDADDFANTPRDFVIDGKVGDDLLGALAASVEELKQRKLAPDAALAEAQFTIRGSERIPISGLQRGGTLNYTRTIPNGPVVVVGASYVQAVTYDDNGPVANAVLTYSQSTDPASSHFADQTREFSRLQLHRYPYSDAEIAADAIGAPLTIRQ
ncbi:MAG TPA: penicillin acylase family protein [Nevskiaceae bacterium]|nr:penicillin acylase family protein [Nevskiaceae bacterium]